MSGFTHQKYNRRTFDCHGAPKKHTFSLFFLVSPPRLDPNICYFLLALVKRCLSLVPQQIFWSSVLGISDVGQSVARSHNPLGALETDWGGFCCAPPSTDPTRWRHLPNSSTIAQHLASGSPPISFFFLSPFSSLKLIFFLSFFFCFWHNSTSFQPHRPMPCPLSFLPQLHLSLLLSFPTVRGSATGC